MSPIIYIIVFCINVGSSGYLNTDNNLDAVYVHSPQNCTVTISESMEDLQQKYVVGEVWEYKDGKVRRMEVQPIKKLKTRQVEEFVTEGYEFK
jgi:hypothetical protein